MAKLQTRIDAKLTGFLEKVKAVQTVSNRTFPEELNKQMLQVIIGGKGVRGLVQLTQKATEARIRADLARPVTRRLKGGQVITGTLVSTLAAQWLHKRGIKITATELKVAENQIINIRTEHRRAYIAASWLWAARGLARHVQGTTLTRLNESDLPTIANGRAHNAFNQGTYAVPGNLRVSIFNTALGADKIAAKAVPRALGNATRDMGKYIARKWGENFARQSRGASR